METLSWVDEDGIERAEQRMVMSESGAPVMETAIREVVTLIQQNDLTAEDALAFYLTTEEGQQWPDAIQTLYAPTSEQQAADWLEGLGRIYIPG